MSGHWRGVRCDAELLETHADRSRHVLPLRRQDHPFNGASDPWVSHDDTLDYFKRNKAASPDFDSSRFYSVPGMAHCEGGGLERFDMLTAIVNWVEKGEVRGRV